MRAYLELMHMRMPDRLQFALHVDDAALALRCPPMTLLTLVENAVRHGIDPSEEGGRIDVDVERRGDRCIVRVVDTGVGLRRVGQRARHRALDLARATAARSSAATPNFACARTQPRGVCAELDLPAQQWTP